MKVSVSLQHTFHFQEVFYLNIFRSNKQLLQWECSLKSLSALSIPLLANRSNLIGVILD